MGKNSPVDNQQHNAPFAKIVLSHANSAACKSFSIILLMLCIIGYLIWLLLLPRDAVKGLLAAMAWLSVGFAGFRLAACLLLVPLFHEVQMVEQLMTGLERLNYPHEKLEIILITEEVDPFTTLAVAEALRPPFRHVIVPKGLPQTKPRALNYALASSKGDFITIYDAEDRPHPDQLLAAISAFEARPDWAAVQAPLNYFNDQDNWLTRQFSMIRTIGLRDSFLWNMPHYSMFGSPFLFA